MSAHPDEKTSRQKIEDALTQENLRKPFDEFPKHLYHPDGRSIIVNSRTDQDARGEEFFESPDKAQAEAARRDKRDSDAFVSKVNAEAAASARKPK